jgi:hypothetical protein
MYKINDMLPQPDIVAKAIYRAANDGSNRLRYSPNGEILLLLHALLPGQLWQSLVKRIMIPNVKQVKKLSNPIKY